MCYFKRIAVYQEVLPRLHEMILLEMKQLDWNAKKNRLLKLQDALLNISEDE